jgi:hypothetical protein
MRSEKMREADEAQRSLAMPQGRKKTGVRQNSKVNGV